MSLRGVKVLLRVIGALVLLFGLYLIFFQKQFFGLFLIIGAFLILPSLEDRRIKDNSSSVEDKIMPSMDKKAAKVGKPERSSDS